MSRISCTWAEAVRTIIDDWRNCNANKDLRPDPTSAATGALRVLAAIAERADQPGATRADVLAAALAETRRAVLAALAPF